MSAEVAATEVPNVVAGGDETDKPLSKTERRRLSKKRKKDNWYQERLAQSLRHSKKGGPNGAKQQQTSIAKMTHEERKEKYTNMARDKRDRKTMSKRFADTVCFYCREKGHSADACPKKGENKTEEVDKICYKCGSTEHALRDCHKFKKALAQLARKKNKQDSNNRYIGGTTAEQQQQEDNNDNPRNDKGSEPVQAYVDLPYATCFVCGDMGHLSSVCTKNPNGIYADGGSCRYCHSKFHLAKDCPKHDAKPSKPEDENIEDDGFEVNNLEQTNDDSSQVNGGDDIALPSNTSPDKKKNKKKVINF
jgi:zinc finger CCHC domain-containing protein 9